MANSASTAGNGGKDAGYAGADLQADLQGLREDVARLARQVGEIFGAHGTEAWERARREPDRLHVAAHQLFAAVAPLLHEVGALEHGDVFLHGGEAHRVAPGQRRHAVPAAGGEGDDVAPGAVGQGVEDAVDIGA